MLEKFNGIFKRDFSNREVINFIIYSMIIIMPFIIVKNLNPNYLMGKVIFTYVMGVLLLIVLIKDNFKSLKKLLKKQVSFKKEDIKNLFKENIETRLILVMFLALLFSTLFGIDIMNALLGNKNRYEGLFIYGIYFLMFIASTKYIVINKKNIEFICIVASFMAIYTVLQLHGIDPIFKFLKGSLAGLSEFGFIGNRNFLSTYLLIFEAISMGAFIFYKNNRYLIYSTIIFAGLLSGQTRGVWVGFLAMSALGFLFIIKDKQRLKRAGIILICFSAAFLIINFSAENRIIKRSKTIVSDIEKISSNDKKEIKSVGSNRVSIWIMTLKSIKKNPILGTGPDTLHLRLVRDVPEDVYSMILSHRIYPDKAHNEFLEYWATGGILTLVSYLGLVIIILVNLFKKRDKISKIFIIIIFGYLVQSFFNISVIQVAPIYWIILGLGVRSYKNGIDIESLTEEIQLT